MRYCKSTIFQANHNTLKHGCPKAWVVCDTAKVRFFKQITTKLVMLNIRPTVVCDTAKVRFFKQITTQEVAAQSSCRLFAILQKYDFSSKSQHFYHYLLIVLSCLRYCKSTIFQANHNYNLEVLSLSGLFAILQKYDFSSKSQLLSLQSRTA